VRGDITDTEQARSLVEQAVVRHGRLDMLINNAGATVAS
jgi:NAD(P)-dependent dehydrogenase (short-subunit alcohol dehydrogenase family)